MAQQEYEFNLDLDAIAEAAAALEKQLIARRDYYKEIGRNRRAEMFDWIIYVLEPVIKVCKDREIDQPFELVGFFISRTGIAASDIIWDPREGTDKLYVKLSELLQGGIPFREFDETPYARSDSYPEKLLPLLKAQAAKERQEREQRAKEQAQQPEAGTQPQEKAVESTFIPNPDYSDPKQNIYMQNSDLFQPNKEPLAFRIGQWLARLLGR
ncbi:hypothetical protein BWD09_10370 [Neisseria dentiae]|uniref:Uncharacterized protein n=1 Tax=Neisseria dentiae TaxID=194197 RepID=A0A1X3D3M7_9NEIS|nr:hypothetical protein [Neisseria dentiae]OSI14498.1 hypothetical protein BWD09_10370 [Neisseria dentiae]QMT44341.1 hypothetical protein H3L92_07580 [Neisseria dentiae]STZ50027.1 Uncharacterised protein [Neisseria dentiae]